VLTDEDANKKFNNIRESISEGKIPDALHETLALG